MQIGWLVAVALAFGMIGGMACVLIIWNLPIVFLFLHVASRLALDSLHELTYAKVGPGVSIVLLYSLAVTAFMGLYLLLKKQVRIAPWGVLCVALAGSAVFGTVITHAWTGFATIAIRWIYLWLLIDMTRYICERSGPRPIALVLLVCLLYPVGNMAVSGALHGGKMGAEDEVSYIGTFGHESNVAYVLFALIAFACGMIGSAKTPIRKMVYLGLTFVGYVALYLDNYRTALVSLFFYWMLIGYFLWLRIGAVTRLQIVVGGTFLVVVAGFVIGDDVVQKFGELGPLITNPGHYFDWSRPPVPNGLLSGRIDIINQYMYMYVHAPPLTQLTGFGLENAQAMILNDKYAHNEYIGALVEEGLIGLVVLVTVLLVGFVRVIRIARSGDWLSTNVAGLAAAIVAMSMGTMPFRDSRAVLYLGVALGMLEWYGERAREKVTAKAAVAAEKQLPVAGFQLPVRR